MYRTGLLAAIVMILASAPASAQPGQVNRIGGGMGGMGGGMGGMGGGMGGMGGGMVEMGGAMAPAMMRQARRFARAADTEMQRSAQVEMEGGQRLTGKIDLGPVIVDGDLGQYAITPEKIKMIRFLKAINDVKPADDAERNNGQAGGDIGAAAAREFRQIQGPAARMGLPGRGGGGGPATVGDPNSRTGMAVLTRGKVVTTADQEIIGMIHIPSDFGLELEFGSLTLAPIKLRSITFTNDHRDAAAAKAGAGAGSSPEHVGRPVSSQDAGPPRYFRHDRSIIVISPAGDRVTLYNLDTKKSESLALSGSKDASLEVTPVLAGNLVALMLQGPKVTKIAVADTDSGTWHSQPLRKPVEGRAVPIVAPGVVVYSLGRDIYAYGVESQRWDVAELPEGVRSTPVVQAGTVTIESQGHIYTFTSKTGKWDHVDVRAILEGAGVEKKS